MENTEIDWENDPILNDELDERIRVYLQSNGDELPNIDALFDEQSLSSISTPSEFSVNTPSSVNTPGGQSESSTETMAQSPTKIITEASASAVIENKKPEVEPAAILAALTMPPPPETAVKRAAPKWEPPAAKRIKYETKLTRYTAKKQMYFERFRSMKTKLRKLQIPNSLPPDPETIQLFDEVNYNQDLFISKIIL